VVGRFSESASQLSDFGDQLEACLYFVSFENFRLVNVGWSPQCGSARVNYLTSLLIVVTPYDKTTAIENRFSGGHSVRISRYVVMSVLALLIASAVYAGLKRQLWNQMVTAPYDAYSSLSDLPEHCVLYLNRKFENCKIQGTFANESDDDCISFHAKPLDRGTKFYRCIDIDPLIWMFGR